MKREILYGFSLKQERAVENRKCSHYYFFLFRNNTATRHRTEKRNTNEKKNGSFYICCALVVAKEKRDERDARKSSSSYSSPFTVLARCHASFRHGFFERVSERNFKSSRVSNVSVRFICLSSSPFLVLRIIVCTRCALSSRILSLSLSENRD